MTPSEDGNGSPVEGDNTFVRAADDETSEAGAPEDISAEETGTEPGSAEEVDAELDRVRQEATEFLEGWQRARAELTNYKKRVERERSDLADLLRGEAIEALLPVLDDFDRAVETQPEELRSNEWVSGIALIYRKLQTILADQGVVEIIAVGQPFDPELHEAVMQRESDEIESGHVIEVLRRGYRIGNRVLRPAMVSVAR